MQHLDEGTIHAWLDGALPAEEARQAEAHVEACRSCSAAVAEARGLIAASSMILSKLDTFPASVDQRFDAGIPPVGDIAAARAASEARQRPAERRWFGGAGFRAAAAVLVLAGSVAVVQSVTGRDELARVVNDQAMESKVSSAESVPAEPMVAQDATAASAEPAPIAPPRLTVGSPPALPRPMQVVGGMTPTRRGAPRGMVGDVSGTLAGTEAGTGRSGATPTRASAVATESSAGRAVAGQGSGADSQPAEVRQERDFSTAAKAAVTAPASANLAVTAPAAPAPTEPPPGSARTDGAASSQLDRRRLADTTLVQREARRQAEERVAPQQRFSPPVAARGQIAQAAIAAMTDRADASSGSRCYTLTLTPWSPARAVIPGAPATRLILSPDTGTVGPSKGQRLVRPMPGSFEGSYAAAWWTEVSPSTLVLTWATGSEGIIMRLVRSGDALAGTARTFGTAGGAEQSSSVQGSQVGCGEAR